MGLSVAEKIRLIMKRQKITMGDLAEASGQTRQNDARELYGKRHHGVGGCARLHSRNPFCHTRRRGDIRKGPGRMNARGLGAGLTLAMYIRAGARLDSGLLVFLSDHQV